MDKYVPILMSNDFAILCVQLDEGYHIYVSTQELVILFVVY